MIEYSLDVTDRHRAEEALKESEDRYRNLVENSLTGVYVRQGERFVFVNERLAQITGYSKKEMLETSFVEFIHPEDRSLALERAAGIEAGTLQAEPFEYRIITKRGDIRWIEAFGTKISYQGKSAVLANAADVTERKYAAEALRKSEEQYRLHFENMKDVIYTTDRNLLITSMSPSVEALLGYRPEEMVGRRADELSVLATKEYERALSATSRLLAGEKVPPTEYEFIAKDGAVKVGEVSSSTMSKDGEVVTIINVARDITERKKAEAATRESEERYRSLFENTPIQIVVVDSDGVVTAANNARRASAGQPPKPGDRMYIDYASLHEHDMRAELMDCMVSGVPKEFPEQPYGKRVLWIRMSPFPGGAIIISEDISERKRGEEWLKRSHSLLSATLESTADGIMVVDMQGNMLSSNRRFVEMWKIPEYVIASRDDEQVRSFFLEQLKSPDEAIQEEDKVYADPEKERLDILEFKDGRIFERYTRPQKMGGKNVGIVFSFRDVTERRRAERALENSLSLLGATLESTADGILVVDMNGVNRNFNSRFLEIWNLTPEMMVSLDKSEVLTFRMNQLKDRERNIERTRLINSDPDREWMDVLEFSDGRVVERYSRPQKLGEKTVGKVLSYHDITERRRIEKSILESREQLRSLTSQLSLAEERERRRIANQLHDRVGQSLLASKMKLGTARESELPKALEEPLDEVYRLIEQTIRDVRSLTFELSPPILYMLGFEAAVEWLTEQAEKQYGIKCEFEDDGAVKPLDDDIRVLLFQNVRELLVNVCKHSQAQNAKVYVSLEDDAIRVSVEDNGVGFDASGVETHWDESSGFGLFSIRERLNQFGGGFEIDSEPGRGTRITLTAPLKAEDETTEGEQT
jgi:PAS domain S-box-containing protein